MSKEPIDGDAGQPDVVADTAVQTEANAPPTEPITLDEKAVGGLEGKFHGGRKDVTLTAPLGAIMDAEKIAAKATRVDSDFWRTIFEFFAREFERPGSRPPRTARDIEEAQWQIDGSVQQDPTDGTGEKKIGRLFATTCFAGKYLSATVRGEMLGSPRTEPVADWIPGQFTYDLLARYIIEELAGEEAPTSTTAAPAKKPCSGGLIVVCGSTNSGKSELSKAIALASLRQKVDEHRREVADNSTKPPSDRKPKDEPHLVCYEDPIESWKVRRGPAGAEGVVELKSPDDAREYGFTLTARQKGFDVLDLPMALSDAKRQTPACFFVGEVRAESEWDKILEFSGSGHLIVVTTHAASVSDSILRILKAVKARTPADRRMTIGHLRAVYHGKVEDIAGLRRDAPEKVMKVPLPAVWSAGEGGIHALVSDGVSSVIADGKSCFSRAQFVERYSDWLTRDRRAQLAAGRPPGDVRDDQILYGRSGDRTSKDLGPEGTRASVHQDIIERARDLDLQELCGS